MKRIRKQLSDQNVRYCILLISLSVVLMISIIVAYLYTFYYNAVYKEFCVSDRIYLTSITDQHEKDLQIISDMALQMGISDCITEFRLEDNPLKGIELKERLYQYMSVNQFAHDIVCAYHKDEYLFNAASSHEVNRFFRSGLSLEQTSSEELKEMVYGTNREKIILKEQYAQGYLMSAHKGNSSRIVCISYPIPPKFVSTLLLVIDGQYYDELLNNGESAERETCIVYDNQIVVRRGTLELSEQVVLNTLAGLSENQQKIRIGNEQYLVSAKTGESGVSYYTLQPLDAFYDKMISKQWGMLILLGISCIPTTLMIIFWGHKLIVRVKGINELLDEGKEDYSLRSIETGIQSLLNVSRSTSRENLIRRREEFLEHFIKKEYVDYEGLQKAAMEAGIDIESRFFSIILMKTEKSDFEKMLQMVETQDIISGYGMTMLHKNQCVFVLFGTHTENIKMLAERMFQEGKNRPGFVAATSCFYENYEDAPRAYLEANAALNELFLIDNSRMLCYEDISIVKQKIDLPISAVQKLKNAVYAGNIIKTNVAIEEIMDHLKSESYTVMAVQSFFVELVQWLIEGQRLSLTDFSKVFDIFALSGCHTVRDYQEYLKNVCQWLIVQRMENILEADEDVTLAVAYLEEHYGDTELNIGVLAQRLSCNQMILGTKFKKNVGMNPSDYLIHVRMEHAKKMLATSSMLVKEISMAVGYEDDHVFMKRFKKYTGLTPLQYRRSKQETI